MQEVQWKKFEKDCCTYLNRSFSKDYNCKFQQKGGSDSHEPDIEVVRNGQTLFAIETKSNLAQCGQFVLFPNVQTKKFDYSSQNEFPENEYAKKIISSMNKNFDLYSRPSNTKLEIDDNLIYDWIIDHYKNGRNSLFVISKKDNYVIFPVERFEHYFNVEAKYRIKASGSGDPSKNQQDDVKNVLDSNNISYSNLAFSGKKMNVELYDEEREIIVLNGSKYKYQFKKNSTGLFNVRRLSNTRNANVIFSIKLKCEQDEKDLKTFKKFLR